jgi:midasin (ATPase involved in ribosome maturation)
LEGKDEEEVHAVELDGDQGGPKNDTMSSVNGNTQQEDADAALEEEVRSNVSRLASPPPLI